jgi:DNA glycosylase AlkZ-like
VQRPSNILRLRLANHHLATQTFREPRDLVAWLGAVQAQDYSAAKWAVGQRLKSVDDSAVDRALDDGTILRTHVMRPTWHFVVPEDIRYLLALTAPRVRQVMASSARNLELDGRTLARCRRAIAKALGRGQMLTRAEIKDALHAAGVNAEDSVRLGNIMLYAELDGVVCSGTRRGKQHTYALLDARAPKATRWTRDEALAELSLRYFRSHGPALLKDFVWWSGLTTSDARAGVEMNRDRLHSEAMGGKTYWLAEPARKRNRSSTQAALLPNFDEYVVGYADRSAISELPVPENPRANILFNHTVVVAGSVVGTWTKAIVRDRVLVEIRPVKQIDRAARRAVEDAAGRYGAFLGRTATVAFRR